MMYLPQWARSGRVLLGLSLVLVVVFAALFAPWLAPNDPNRQDLLATLVPPAWAPGGNSAWPLGTDSLGRCILSRLIYVSHPA